MLASNRYSWTMLYTNRGSIYIVFFLLNIYERIVLIIVLEDISPFRTCQQQRHLLISYLALSTVSSCL